jgi:hypothetical protein
MKRTASNAAPLLFVLGPWLAGCSTVNTLVKPDGPADGQRPAKSEEAPPRGAVEFDATPAALNQAIPQAMADLQMTYVRTRKNGLVYQIDGETADRRSVNVTIRPGLGKSRLSSRIGWFGDTLLSKALAERIGIRAGLLPPKPIPDQPPSSPDPNPIFSRSAVSDDEMFRDIAEAPYRDSVIP